MKWKVRAAGLLLPLVMLASACGGEQRADGGVKDEGGEPQRKTGNEPVKLLVLGPAYDKFMKEYGGDFVVKKYPHLSFEMVGSGTGQDTIQRIAAEKVKVDLIITSFNVYSTQVKPFGLTADMSDLIRKHKFELGRLEPAYLDMIRNLEGGKLTALPFSDNRMILFYNRDLFHKFGVPYPTDGMTWDSLYEVARRMTREDGGLQYRGFAANPGALVIMNQLSLSFIDPMTQKARLHTDKWKQYIETFLPLYQMPGYFPADGAINSTAFKNMTKDPTTAMIVLFHTDAKTQQERMNWDVVRLPEMKDRPGFGSYPYPTYMSVASTSGHRDEAFLTLAELLSDEVQSQLSARFAQVTPLTSPQVKADFGRDVDIWKGKNISAVTSQQPAPAPEAFGPYDTHGVTALTSAMIELVAGTKDANTALRDAEEQMNKKIAEQGETR